MAHAKGIHAHEWFRLGKAPAKRDPRNLMLAAIFPKKLPSTPPKFDFDVVHPGIPTPMFANDVYGCCVISGRAHQTLRFEDIEQGSVLSITDAQVTKEYFAQTGGPDSGLVVLDSLKLWRSKGWRAAKSTLKIAAFAEVTPTNHAQVRAAIFFLTGAGFGFSLPKSAQAQTQTGQPWDVVSGPGSAPGSWGGHYVHAPGYNAKGPVCVTWGRKQQITWAFVDKYCDEAYAIVDDADSKKHPKIDVAKLKEFLGSL